MLEVVKRLGNLVWKWLLKKSELLQAIGRLLTEVPHELRAPLEEEQAHSAHIACTKPSRKVLVAVAAPVGR